VNRNWRKIGHVIRDALDHLSLAEMASPLPSLTTRGQRAAPALVTSEKA
jgi:hypothetical protein